MQHIILMRGLPGSGKSTVAREIASRQGGHVFSADDHFVGEDGVYRYDAAQVREAHIATMRRLEAVARLGARLMIVDNTSMRLREMEGYLHVAAVVDAEVSVQLPTTPWAWDVEECARKTIHGVPADRIATMAQRWEPLDEADLRRFMAQMVAGAVRQ